MLVLLEELWPSAELVAVAREVPEELRTFQREKSRAELEVLVKTLENTGTLAVAAPFTKDYPIPEQGARYYLCQSVVCAQPVDKISKLETFREPI